MNWYDDREELQFFASVLVAEMYVQTTEDLLYFFEKPWKWTREYELWVRFDRSQAGDIGWPDFEAEMEALIHA